MKHNILLASVIWFSVFVLTIGKWQSKLAIEAEPNLVYQGGILVYCGKAFGNLGDAIEQQREVLFIGCNK